MTALVLDAGALIAIDRGDRALVARLEAVREASDSVRTSAIVIAQVWRDSTGRQVSLGRLLRAVEIHVVDDELARAAGTLLARAGMTDPIDAIVVLVADDGDEILTSDPDDIARLAAAAERRVAVTRC